MWKTGMWPGLRVGRRPHKQHGRPMGLPSASRYSAFGDLFRDSHRNALTFSREYTPSRGGP